MLMPSIFGGRFFDDDWMEPFTLQNSNDGLMKTDIEEHKNSYLLTMDVPGVKKEDIHAELSDGYLTISASNNVEKDEKDKEGNYIRKERYSGSASRSFYVGKDVKQEDIKAKFENGTIKLLIPKVEEKNKVEQKHNIQIEG